MLNRNLITGKCYRDGVEITEAEYKAALAEIQEKAELVDKFYKGDIELSGIPDEWREEIQQRADERRRAEQEEPELSAEEALDIILGGETA